MSDIYFPSCKFTAFSPKASKQICDYLKKHFKMSITNCCKTNYSILQPDDTAVTICNTCSAICDESSKTNKVISIWEVLAKDDNFSFPDYGGEKITLQDCWRTYDKQPIQKTVRILLEKMNLQIVELDENYHKTRFCGISTLNPPVEITSKLAPKRFVENANGMFKPHTQKQQAQLMKEHCEKITTEKVACYCLTCNKGLEIGGKSAKHLLNLLFQIEE